MTDREKAIVMAYTGICMLTGDKLSGFYKYVESIMGRPVYTHEMGTKVVDDLIKEKARPDFIALCADEGSSEKPNKRNKSEARRWKRRYLDLKQRIFKLEERTRWIPVSERLPETDNKNSINNYNVLLWVKNRSHPEREPQIYLGKLRHIDGDDGSGNFWGIETKPCDWTIWGWCYFEEPEVIAWMPLPEPYKANPTGAEKLGHWRTDKDNSRHWDRIRFYCSECGDWQTYGSTKYCPNCGARMEVQDDQRTGN